jgi:phage shock protein PspC (stress-responsive transcriptional regulator)
VTTLPAPAAPRLLRRRAGRALGGVATGLSAHLGIPVLWVRLAFLALAVTGGSGVALYAAFWLVLPVDDGEPAMRSDDRVWGEVAALVALGAGLVLALRAAGLGLPTPALVPLVAAGVGAALVWRQADDARRARWRASATTGRGPLVTALGIALLFGGALGFLATRGQLGAAREGLLSTAVVVGGLALLLAPWLLRTLADLNAERTERIRSQERAELAGQVHDSVLQTLALIQQSARTPARSRAGPPAGARAAQLALPARRSADSLSAVLEQRPRGRGAARRARRGRPRR